MKKIVIALLVPFALAAAGCDRNESVMDQRAAVEEKPTRTTTQSNSTDTVTTGPTDAPAPAQERTTTAQGPTTTETPASQSKY